MAKQTATFGGGCFWCLDAIFRYTKGISLVMSGYAGGADDNPNYDKVHYNNSGHVEAVQVEFDDEIIPYEALLDIFWTMHNPTTPNQDGANFGEEYRSVIFYHDDEQKSQAEKSRKTVAAELYKKPIITAIEPFKNFYQAEEEHQSYYKKNPSAPYCTIVIDPKIEKIKARYAQYLKD
ncbi:peptide-methionine (S)-S-oxide reductase MsrA [Candidatus Saccharibacteria bacterium]|jgi:peptide-methionine (S)-S-oxide reductase|nr:peptide-methionine (S)-S-oxide reductase MsrA [Candidatus Saccharibacteria bacterium]